MNAPGFEGLLKRRMGLDSASIGSSAVERAVKARMRSRGLSDQQAYWELIQASPLELQELVEAVIVPETWFFRHRESFSWLARIGREHWSQNLARNALRILSLPCSTGEEPYSIAMALLDAELPANCFHVDAIDISERALEHAATAVYGRNSFRGSDLGFRDRYFTPTAAGYQLGKSVSERVRFQQGNLLDPRFLLGAASYDLIFCRNLLIYFDTATQERAVGVLSKLLSVGGTFFVGPSEGNLLLDQGYVSAKAPLSFAFRRESAASQTHAAAVRQLAPRPTVTRTRVHIPQPRHAETRATATADVEIAQIRSLADRGHIADAARLCEDYLHDHGSSAEGLHLFGVIRDATGKHDEAAAYYRKTLYLDPNHHDALAHLALLLERQGDNAGAKLLNERVRRLEQRQAG